jgi:ribosomal protein L11 methyltransferase
VAVAVPVSEAEPARAAFLVLFPAGFEEREVTGGVELAGYTDAAGEIRFREVFAGASASHVAPGWEERWRRFHRPVRIGPLWIGPPWEEVPSGAVTVVIEPARAFGTGAHPTTRLCAELLVDLRAELGGAGVLDVGCGSGVLAIAAARLGYRPVHALDLAPEAVEATARNAAANGADVEVVLADALQADLPEAELAVANLTRPAIEELAPRLECRVLVASGYLERDPTMLARFRHRERRAAEGWAADVYDRR